MKYAKLKKKKKKDETYLDTDFINTSQGTQVIQHYKSKDEPDKPWIESTKK